MAAAPGFNDGWQPGGPGSAIDYGDPALLSHDNAGPEANAVAWSLLGVSGVFLGLRVYCKYYGHRRLWWDDRILIAAWIVHLVGCSLLSVMIAGGYGKHPWDEPSVDMLVMMTRTTFTITAATWSKTSFAITMLRIANNWVKWATWFILVSLNMICGLNAMIGWVGCTPVQKSWNRAVQGTCLPFSFITNLGYVAGAYSSACDFLLALLPWPIIWSLQMRTHEKIGVGIAMSMGILAGIMAAAKTASLSKLATNDSFDAAHLSMFDSAEISVTIMAASLPAMRVLFRDLGGEVRRYYYGDTGVSGTRGRVGGSVVVAGGVENGRMRNKEVKDDGSDREILGVGRGGIVREVEVEVEYGRASEGEEGYEMQQKR